MKSTRMNWQPKDNKGRFHKPGDPVKPGNPAKQRRPRRRVQHTISCWKCGKVFTANRSDARYCSDNCRVLASYHRQVALTDQETTLLNRFCKVDPACNDFVGGISKHWGKAGLKQLVNVMMKVVQADRVARAAAPPPPGAGPK